MSGDTPTETDASATVVDDLPDALTITEDELALYEAHLLDILTAMIQHGD